MTIDFKKYSSIQNSYIKEFISRIISAGYAGNTEYIVQEKAHGANVSFWKHKDEEIRLASRPRLLRQNEPFFNFQEVFKANKRAVEYIFAIVKKQYKCDQIALFGELIGGRYPHPSIDKIKTRPVQNEIYYCPHQTIYFFDIMLDGVYINITEFNRILDSSGLLYSTSLFKGTLAKCLQYSNIYQTTIPEKLALPPVENNICEGNVIKPVDLLYLGCGSRIIIKNKNSKFAERQKVEKRQKNIAELPAAVVNYIHKANEYINENRLRNVLSKLGQVTKSDFGTIASAFSKDAIDDFIKDNEDYRCIEQEHQKIITKNIGKGVANLIRKNLDDIVCSNF